MTLLYSCSLPRFLISSRNVQGGTIKDSINLPAQSIYYSIPALYNIFTAAGVQAVVFYCGKTPLDQHKI